MYSLLNHQLLHLISRTPLNGLQLHTQLKLIPGVSVSKSIVYIRLHALERDKLITGRLQIATNSRVYQITAKGRSVLHHSALNEHQLQLKLQTAQAQYQKAQTLIDDWRSLVGIQFFQV